MSQIQRRGNLIDPSSTISDDDEHSYPTSMSMLTSCKSKARNLAKCKVPVHVMEDDPQVLLGKSHCFMLGGINNPELAANSMETNW